MEYLLRIKGGVEMFKDILRKFTKFEIDIDELVDFIVSETNIDRDIVEIILDTEEVYLREKGIVY